MFQQNNILHILHDLSCWYFSCYDAMRILKTDITQSKAICQEMASCHRIQALTDEYYIVPDSPYLPKYPLVASIPLIRSGEWWYLSFETMLAEYNMLSAAPYVLTVATFGESGRYELPFGEIQFTHVDDIEEDPTFFVRHCLWDSDRECRVAGPQLAYDDYQIYRPIHEAISSEDLEHAIACYPSYPILPDSYSQDTGLIL